MRKRRNRVYRRIAVALTVALLAGQSHAFVLAEEDVGGAPQTEITGEAGTPDNDSTLDNDSTTDGGNADNAGGERRAAHSESAAPWRQSSAC